MNDYDVRRAFERIELELIESMKRNLGRHLAEEEKEGFRWNMWQEEQLKSLKAYQRANREKFSKRFSRINEEIEDYIRKNADNAAIAEELRILRKTVDPKVTIDDLMDDLDRKDADFFRVNSPKLDELLKATREDMEKAEHAMLRKTNDQYRKIIFDSQVYANTGAGTLKQAVDMASRDFLRAGINCIKYKDGRLVNIASYAEMAIRTANQRAVLISEGNIRQQQGWHLVRISRYGVLRHAFHGKAVSMWMMCIPGARRQKQKIQAIRCFQKPSPVACFIQTASIARQRSSKECKMIIPHTESLRTNQNKQSTTSVSARSSGISVSRQAHWMSKMCGLPKTGRNSGKRRTKL